MKLSWKLYGLVLVLALVAMVHMASEVREDLGGADDLGFTQAEGSANVYSQVIAADPEWKKAMESPPRGAATPWSTGIAAHIQGQVSAIHDHFRRNIVVVDVKKRIIADAIPANAGTIYSHDSGDEVGKTLRDGNPRRFVEKSADYSGGAKQVVVPISPDNTIVGAVIVEYTAIAATATAAAREKMWNEIGEMFFFIAISGVILVFLSKKITFPLRRLSEAAEGISHGNLDLRVQTEGKDEIGVLTSAFNRMAANLKKSFAELERMRDGLEETVRGRTAELERVNATLSETTKRLERYSDELEERVRERTVELETLGERQKRLIEELKRSNKDLESFAYVVSHDLKAPLRGISSLAGWLREDYVDRLDEEGKRSLALLVDRAKQMDGIIDAILKYSRTGRAAAETMEVDLNETAREAVELSGAAGRATVTFETSLPVVRGNKIQLAQVFQNLVSNAVVHNDKPHAEIRIGAVDEGSRWRCYVADNGPGIEEKHFDKVFEIFRTLSPKGRGGGSGIGLAIVKRIVEQHGGRVGVESPAGGGSTFFFTLPKAPGEEASGKPKKKGHSDEKRKADPSG